MPLPLAHVGDEVGGGSGSTSIGKIIGQLGTGTFDNGPNAVACAGDTVTPHGPGLHANATLIASVKDTSVNFRNVCYEADFATCGCFILTAGPDIWGKIGVWW
jgi:hypothetical protein